MTWKPRMMTAHRWEFKNGYDSKDGMVDLGEITCEVTGQMDDGTMIWTDIEDGEEYICWRMCGKHNFTHI